ncbi:MAG TPA: enoyl-CoA hydratase/isomerase family protein, partial [Terriglobales bacterium]|nr:enoyl-CoA hydratase/isomerase family protein [Terriglobales bacterium]
MAYDTIDLSIRDHVAHLTFNRPEAMNSIDLALARDFMQAALECDENRDVRAVLLSGNGRMFCSGGDLKTFAGKGETLPAYLKEVT